MSASGAESPEADQNTPIDSPQFSTVVQGAGESQEGRNPSQFSTPVPKNIFRRSLQGTLGFNAYQVWVLVEEGYYTQDAVLYWNFTDIQ